MAIESTTTTPDRTSKGPDDMSWRPMQRSTRVAVFAALAVTLFYMIFLLNPAYRGNTWVWILVLFVVRPWAWGRRGWGPGSPAGSAEAVLAERYARGEVTEEEYRARLEVLRTRR